MRDMLAPERVAGITITSAAGGFSRDPIHSCGFEAERGEMSIQRFSSCQTGESRFRGGNRSMGLRRGGGAR